MFYIWACSQQLFDDRLPDESGGPGDEYGSIQTEREGKEGKKKEEETIVWLVVATFDGASITQGG